MGGIIIIVAILVPVLLLGRMRNIYIILMIITTLWLGFLGGLDDYINDVQLVRLSIDRCTATYV